MLFGTGTTCGKVFVTEGDAWVGFYAAYALLHGKRCEKVLVGVRQGRARDSDLVEQLRGMGAEIIEYDPTSAAGAGWKQHLQGVQAVVLVPVHDETHMAAWTLNVLKAAEAEHACKHVVLWSCLGAGIVGDQRPKDESAIFRQFHEIEQGVRACRNIDKVVTLRLGFLMQELFAVSHVMQNRGVLPLTSRTGKVAPVNVKDIAAATARLLTDRALLDKHDKQTLTCTGAHTVTGPSLVEIASKSLEAPIQFQEVSMDQMREILGKEGAGEGQKMDPTERAIFLGYLALFQHNKLDMASKDLATLLGREPADIKAFFTENRDSFRPHRSRVQMCALAEARRCARE